MSDQSRPSNRFFRYPVIAGFVVLWLFLSVSFTSNGTMRVVRTFGSVSDRVLSPGLSFVLPWQSTSPVNVLTVKEDEVAHVPTSEGVTVKIEAVLNYSVRPDAVIDLYRAYNGNHVGVLVVPQFKAALRNSCLAYKAEDLYNPRRGEIEAGIAKHLKEVLEYRGIVVEEVLLADLELPQTVRSRIEAKLAAEQDAKRMEFVLKQAEQQAEVRRVEAKGIADAQVIIKKDLDKNYLIYLWLEALKEHKGSVIYVPTGNDGMPVFKEVK